MLLKIIQYGSAKFLFSYFLLGSFSHTLIEGPKDINAGVAFLHTWLISKHSFTLL